MEYLIIILLALGLPIYYELKIKKIKEIYAAERNFLQKKIEESNLQAKKEIFRKESPKQQDFD